MQTFLIESSYFSIVLTVVAYYIGVTIQKKWKLALLNPILLGSIIVMLTLLLLRLPADVYRTNCMILSWLMTPATICLAISFAQQLEKLRDYLPAIIAGVAIGSISGIGSIFLLSKVFSLDSAILVSLLPKSVTTAIGVALSEQLGGIGAITTVAIILTGVFGNMAGSFIANILHIEHPVARGVSFGTASHVIGTSRAVEESPLSGAVSSLALTLAGLFTSILFSTICMFVEI